VRDKHYDKGLHGVDWNAQRAHYEPLAVGAPDEPTFYRTLNEMLGALGQVSPGGTGPGRLTSCPIAEEPPPHRQPGPLPGAARTGDPGLDR
jgi:hypothetical protein